MGGVPVRSRFCAVIVPGATSFDGRFWQQLERGDLDTAMNDLGIEDPKAVVGLYDGGAQRVKMCDLDIPQVHTQVHLDEALTELSVRQTAWACLKAEDAYFKGYAHGIALWLAMPMELDFASWAACGVSVLHTDGTCLDVYPVHELEHYVWLKRVSMLAGLDGAARAGVLKHIRHVHGIMPPVVFEHIRGSRVFSSLDMLADALQLAT